MVSVCPDGVPGQLVSGGGGPHVYRWTWPFEASDLVHI